MIDRRELLKLSLLGSGAAVTGNFFGSPFAKAALADGATSPITDTTLGKLRGASANGVSSFKGVHYGASTEGAMRFMPPIAPKPWTGVRDALEIGSPSPQDTAGANSTSEIRKA